DDRGLDAVATRLDRYGKAVAQALQHLAFGQHLRVEQLDDVGTEGGKRIRPGRNEPRLGPWRELGAEQQPLQDEKSEEESRHLRFSRNASGTAEDSARNSA